MADGTEEVLERVLGVIEEKLKEAFGDFVLLGEDPKYGLVFATRGSPARDGEPMMLLRGRDDNALTAIDHYANRANESGSPIQVITDVATVHQRFRDWQAQNPELVRPAK